MKEKRNLGWDLVYSEKNLEDATPSEKRALARNKKRREQLEKEAIERWKKKKRILGAKK